MSDKKPDYEKADRIREEMRKEGWAVTDTPEGSFVFYVGDLDKMPKVKK